MGKNLPAIDFHAAVAKRDPLLADRLRREGLSLPQTLSTGEAAEPEESSHGAPSSITPASPVPTSPSVTATPPENDLSPRRRRGLVPRANGQEAGRITVYVPPALVLKLKQFCFDCDRTVTDVAGEVLVEALERKLVRAQ